ncbi:GNAT family N-acetyltransferase [Amycolatopsis sp. OK19-0408]|uniref:GNAT family N-acetyltransferase n=1 Tax=Amycolatopsis iheyensis TaxID=2945988 RepID=A0A9X2NB14_9PSEU|nr:GNAT family N-acetyltransferase [Amycolatopsis iheyensis]MCR6483394.1 GNAT family N-acetyltransferase [Amycolatopsis iheyensis]
MTDLGIRPASYADLAALVGTLGNRAYFVERYLRQENGLGVLFTAWLGDIPVGVIYLWLEQAEEPEIAACLPSVPLLTHIEVVAPLRSRGIGRTMVGAAEQHLVERGHDRVALAVRTDNRRAARLYRRLGYQDWGHGVAVCYAESVRPGGEVVREPEWCHVFVKELAGDLLCPRSPQTSIGSLGRA